IEVYLLTGERPPEAENRLRRRLLTPFHGRTRELAFLKEALSAAERGAGNVVGIRGPLGGGKSRLCYEFLKWCREDSIPTLQAGGLIYGHATPLRPVLDTLRRFFDVSPFDEPATTQRKIEARV